MPTKRTRATIPTLPATTSKTSATSKGIMDWMGQYRAARRQMKFIVKSLADKTVSLEQETTPSSVTVSDLKRLCLWPLCDFQEALKCDIAQDVSLLMKSDLSVSIEDLLREHEDVKTQVADAIRLAENAVYQQLSSEELYRTALYIGEIINRVYELLDIHIAQEENRLSLLNQILNDGYG